LDLEQPMRVLFVKEKMGWPRSSGHDVHTFFLMQAMAQLGHAVALATMEPSPREAVTNGGFEAEYCFQDQNPPTPDENQHPLRLSKSQEKFRNYWGRDADRVRWVAAASEAFQADVVVVSGLNVLPYLGALPDGIQKVWYAADEWVWHHLSQVRLFQKSSWSEIKPAIVKGIYQRAYRKLLDRVWVVSKADARAFRWFAGVQNTDIMPNGVDANHYTPGNEERFPNSCVFWGRLDFGPNIQAIQWFLQKVWPKVREVTPEAKFQIYGFQPGPEIRSLAGKEGVELGIDLPDIRKAVRSHEVVVLPFVSGGGIKNKLLEAAALGMPTLCSKRVITGLNGHPPMPIANSPNEWVTQLTRLWREREQREKLGREARLWVTEHHTWQAAAKIAVAGLRTSAANRPVRSDALATK
jgi:polysaccharide biosynthesis protein PslH